MSVLGERYRLVEQIGVGGSAVVWRGYDLVLNRPVAVKLLNESVAADADTVRRLRHEAQAVAQLTHPYITHVYDFGAGTSDGTTSPYVVMELVSGPTLRELLAGGGSLPWAQAAAIVAQVATAVAAAHQRGIVHRDVTPNNVMIGPNGVKVLDFGIVGLLGERDSSNRPDELLGTPAYVAPERVRSADERVNPPIDVYALGVLWYRMLTGRLPWSAATSEDLVRAHLHEQPSPLPAELGIPDEQAELCQRCLAKDPADRPTATELADRLSGTRLSPLELADIRGNVSDDPDAVTGLLAWATELNTSPHPPPATAAVSRPSRRRIVAASTTGILAATAVAWLATHSAPAADLTEQPGPHASTTAVAQSTPSIDPGQTSTDSPAVGTASTVTPVVPPRATVGPTPSTGLSLTPPPTAPAAPSTAVSGIGGTVKLTCAGNTATIVSLDPAPGYTTRDVMNGHGPGPGPSSVHVVFESGPRHTDISADCKDGLIRPSVKERP